MIVNQIVESHFVEVRFDCVNSVFVQLPNAPVFAVFRFHALFNPR